MFLYKYRQRDRHIGKVSNNFLYKLGLNSNKVANIYTNTANQGLLSTQLIQLTKLFNSTSSINKLYIYT